LGFDGDLDDWPVNEVDVQAVLDSSDTITDEYIAGLQTTQKGYHAIEMLLFGKAADKTVDAFTPRELELLAALAKNFDSTANGLLTSWTDGVDGNPAYREVLATAGTPDNPAYPTLNAAAEEIVQGIIGCLEEVGEEKIGAPLASKNVGEFESQFSQTTLNDLHNNLISAQNAYLGMVPSGSASTNSISSLIESVDSSLDADIKIQFDTALALIEAVPAPIEKTLTDAEAEASLMKAQEAILGLYETFEDKVLPII
ncbi:MAG: peptidase M75, partial [Moorea sp. SIO3C2]|nr:peptidase M75 [Moorena sp. SIO3C2]